MGEILISLLLTTVPVKNKGMVYVLCYHSFHGSKYDFSFSLKELEDHIKRFKKNRFRFISMDDIRYRRVRGARNVLVTIDDGNKTVFQAYRKVFNKYGIRPVLGIYPAAVGNEPYVMTWKMLRKLSREGCEIAAHGYYHLNITKKLFRRDKKAFMKEIYKPRRVLEKKLNRVIDVFIYPFGARSKITVKTIKKAGYKYGFNVDSKYIDFDKYDTDLYDMPRFLLTRNNVKNIFKHIFLQVSKISTPYD